MIFLKGNIKQFDFSLTYDILSYFQNMYNSAETYLILK